MQQVSYKGPARPGTQEQKLFLVSYMEKHNYFAQNEFVGERGKDKLREMWENLTESLNCIPGGSRKGAEQWKKVSWFSDAAFEICCSCVSAVLNAFALIFMLWFLFPYSFGLIKRKK